MTSASLEWAVVVSQALYIAPAGLAVQCVYGAKSSSPPRYNTEAIERIISSGFEPGRFSLGEPRENPAYREASRSLSDLLGSRVFFVIAVMIMVAVMGVALFKAFRRLDLS